MNGAGEGQPRPEALETGAVTIHHKSRRAGRPVAPVKMTLNLTSMIDVIFLLLIYFVITAVFTPGEGIITAKLPHGTGTPEALKPLEQPIRVVVSAAGTTAYRLEIDGYGAPADFRQLYEQLLGLQYDPSRDRIDGTHKPSDPIIIEPNAKVRWQHVVNAFNAAVRARYTNIQFAQAQ